MSEAGEIYEGIASVQGRKCASSVSVQAGLRAWDSQRYTRNYGSILESLLQLFNTSEPGWYVDQPITHVLSHV